MFFLLQSYSRGSQPFLLRGPVSSIKIVFLFKKYNLNLYLSLQHLVF